MSSKDGSISNSEIQTYKSCRRRWYLAYYRELGLTGSAEKSVGARQLGTKVHVALDKMYSENANPIEVVNALYAEDIERWPSAREALQREADLARAMLEGFVQWIEETGADEFIRVVATEQALEVPLDAIPGIRLKGKLDQRVIRELDGARLFRDWKTVGDLSTPLRLLPIDEQMKFYHLLEHLDALDKTGSGPPEPTGGALYAMLRKVKRTGRANPPFYDQIEVRHNLETLRSMWLRTVRVIHEIVALRAELDSGVDHRYAAYPRPSRDCSWSCDFLPICPMFDDGSNVEGLIAEHYTHVDPDARYGTDDKAVDS
jgi:RecB family exonuclease